MSDDRKPKKPRIMTLADLAKYLASEDASLVGRVVPLNGGVLGDRGRRGPRVATPAHVRLASLDAGEEFEEFDGPSSTLAIGERVCAYDARTRTFEWAGGKFIL